MPPPHSFPRLKVRPAPSPQTLAIRSPIHHCHHRPELRRHRGSSSSVSPSSILRGGASPTPPRHVPLLTRPLPSPRRAPGELLRPPPLLSVAPPPHRHSSPSAAGVSFALPWNTPCAPPPARSGPALPPEHGRAAAAPWSSRRSRVADGPALWSGQSASVRLKPEPPVLETGTSGFGLASA